MSYQTTLDRWISEMPADASGKGDGEHLAVSARTYRSMRKGDRVDSALMSSLSEDRRADVLEIADSNARCAWDQYASLDYIDSRGRSTSVQAYADNVLDTLAEKGIKGLNMIALAAYYKRVAELFGA